MTRTLLFALLLGALGCPASLGNPDDDDATDDCGPAQEAIAAEIYASRQYCSAILRLDHETTAPLAWQLLCAEPGPGPDGEAARELSQALNGTSATSPLISGPNPEDQWVFYDSPGDFGGIGAVSATTGLATFGGAIVWDGEGEIGNPAFWRELDELGTGCPPMDVDLPQRGFDGLDGSLLSIADTNVATNVLEQTALPGAFMSGGYMFNAVVLRYPRSVGGFLPETAEWIVLLDGGPLE